VPEQTVKVGAALMGGDSVDDDCEELEGALFFEQEKRHNEPTRTATTAVFLVNISPGFLG